jgi:hypothetical protein
LNNVTLELESAIEIIGILRKELGISNVDIGNNTPIVSNKDIGTDLPRDERSWTQVQINRHRKMKNKLNDHSVLSLRTNNCFEVLTNLNET